MEQHYFEEQTFEKIDYTATPLKKGEYEYCVFRNCDLSRADLSGIRFSDCEFSGCNLSLAVFNQTGLQGVTFKDCKMLGLHFERCNEFGLSVSFQNCSLNHSSFFGVKIKKTVFKNCQLQETDFTDSDLSGSTIENCDFLQATFLNTNLEKADLRSSINYAIDPELNKIKKAYFSLYGVPGLLAKYDIRIDMKG